MVYVSRRLQDIEFTVKVISFTFWDISPVVSYSDNHFPPEAIELHRLYESFYKSKHSERILIWLHNFGNATVSLSPPNGGTKKELTLSKLQALICLYFNKRDKITIEFLKLQTGLLEDTLLSEVLGLVASDILVVQGKNKKETLSGSFTTQDLIVLAPNLDKLKRALQVTKIKKIAPGTAPAPTTGPTGSSGSTYMQNSLIDNESMSVVGLPFGKPQEPTANEDGQFEEFKKVKIESCTMRVMKSNRSMESEDLFLKVCGLLTGRFTLSKRDFKEVLDRLLQHEYLIRSSQNPNVFLYSETDEIQAAPKWTPQQVKLQKRNY